MPPLTETAEGIGGSMAFMMLLWGLGPCLARASAEFTIHQSQQGFSSFYKQFESLLIGTLGIHPSGASAGAERAVH